MKQKKWLFGLLTVALLAVVALSWALLRERAERMVADQQLQAMRARANAPTESSPVATPAESLTEPASAGKAAKRTDKQGNPPLSTDYIRVMEETRAALEGVRKELSAARNELEAARAGAAQEKEEREKVAAELSERNEALEAAKRVATAMEAEVKTKSERLVRVETSEKLVREAAGKAEISSAKTLRSAQELEDLHRRRELLLASINRRYREVTDQYRTLSLRVQGRAEQLGLDPGAGELSRIQTSVQQAEEEMRQLNGLSAQVAKLLRNGR